MNLKNRFLQFQRLFRVYRKQFVHLFYAKIKTFHPIQIDRVLIRQRLNLWRFFFCKILNATCMYTFFSMFFFPKE